jgi:uridine kinase
MKSNPMIIGVAGGSGSGKTTIANAINKELGNLHVVMIQHDSYYKDNSHLSPSEREKINYDCPDSLETKLMVSHLKELMAGHRVEIPLYDFTNHARHERGVPVEPADVIVIDGILILAEQTLRELLDVKIYVDTAHDIRFIRRLQRDIHERGRSIDSVIRQYLQTVRPMHNAYVEPSRQYADIIIPDGHNPVSTQMVVSMIKARIQKKDQKSEVIE